MKRRIGFLILMVVCLCLLATSACAMTHAERVLEEEGVDAFLKLVSPQALTRSVYVEKDVAHLNVYSTTPCVLPADTDVQAAAQLLCEYTLQETAGVGFTVKQVLSIAITPADFAQVSDLTLDVQKDGLQYITPYGSWTWRGGGPRNGGCRYEVIVVAGTDDFGNELEFYGYVENLKAYTEVYSITKNAVPEQDTPNLRHGADFEVEVADGVWWVPVVSMGESRHTNSEVSAQLTMSPEEKQKAYATLYEALQLFQMGDFYNGNDNVRIREENIYWEHHKPGYHAVRTNTGCCATDSNWLNYILKDDYEEVGFFAWSRTDGSGHIINYIKHEGFYYFIDLTHYRTDFLDASAPETGNLIAYRASDFVAGNLHKAESPEAYIQYILNSFNDPPAKFFMYQAQDCLPVDSVYTENGVVITYPNTVDIRVFDGTFAHLLQHAFVDPPREQVDWAQTPSYAFADLTGEFVDGLPEEETVAVPICDYKAGDVLTLSMQKGEYSEAIIDGKTYEYSRYRKEFSVLDFRNLIFMLGGNEQTYYDYMLPYEDHAAQLEKMNSVQLGDIMVDMFGDACDPEIIRCVQEENSLLVTDVWRGYYHHFEPVYITKDASGAWQTPPVIWYLSHYRVNGEEHYEFLRVGFELEPGFGKQRDAEPENVPEEDRMVQISTSGVQEPAFVQEEGTQCFGVTGFQEADEQMLAVFNDSTLFIREDWQQIAIRHMDAEYGDYLFTDVVIDTCEPGEVAEILFKDWRFLMRLNENDLTLKSGKYIITYKLLE